MKKKKTVSRSKASKKAQKKTIPTAPKKKVLRKRFAITAAQKISTKIRDIIHTVEGVQPTDLRLLAVRILERAQKVSEGLKSKK